MNLFPVFQDIDDKNILVVGGGEVAKAKIDRLLQFTDRIRVVAEKSDITCVSVELRAFEDGDLNGADMVVLAMGDKEKEAQIAKKCRERGILVNSASAPGSGNFYMPGLIKRGNLSIGISTGGSSPAYSKHLRKEIEKIIPESIEEILLRLECIRVKLKEEIEDDRVRNKIFREIMILLIERNNDVSEDEIRKIVVEAK
ncbi:MAG: bifunctional precorrin-2 dehydrogenase/sirohydrochlorin ferrochelatase [Hornefia sp.]|nr:bifunctional precorrin-2 dehydrogenase/sirohydrochlorin ferrochelatase [Hornefia sp.]